MSPDLLTPAAGRAQPLTQPRVAGRDGGDGGDKGTFPLWHLQLVSSAFAF